MVQSEWLFSRLLDLLMRVGVPLMKNKHTPLTKDVLTTLTLTSSASATDAVIEEIFMDQEQLQW